MFFKSYIKAFSLSLFLSILFLSTSLNAKYLDSKSCNECHDKIYSEHISSMHHKSSIFSDELHAKMKEKVSPRKYSCALCHTPGAKKLRPLMKGQMQPNEFEMEQKDGVSCFYCHQISKVIFTKHKGINFSSYKGKGKPTFFANLVNAENSDKHNSSSTNNIYKNNQICMGCHSHKKNNNEVEICNTLDAMDKTSDCISCHMPKSKDAPTKLNAKARMEHSSHKFLGIHSNKMVKKAVKLSLKQVNKNQIRLNIENKMGHSIITQPMRLKFVKTIVLRKGKVIWSNFKKEPMEDKKASFFIVFKDKNNNISLPAFSTGYKHYYNLKAKEKKEIIYTIENLRNGDIIKSKWISYIVSPKIAKKLKIEDKEVQKALFGDEIEIKIQ